MADDRISTAMERIDRALSRIETQAALLQHAPQGSDLEARHEALRDKVSASIAELDRLIDGMER